MFEVAPPFLNDLPIDKIGYVAIFVVLLLDGANIPFTPVELFLGLSGYLVAIGEITFAGALLVTVAGNVLGHIISYTLGYMVGRSFFVSYGKYLFITPGRLRRAEKRVRAMGPLAAFVVRVIPGLRSFGSILLGTVRMRFSEFLVLTTAGVTVWNIVFLTLGYYFGITFANYAPLIVPVAIAIIASGLCLAMIVWYIQASLKRRASRNIANML